jgi:hypothetical protein
MTAGGEPLDELISAPDARERFAIEVAAPAPLVFDVAARFDMQSIRLVRAIFRMREVMMGVRGAPRPARGLLDEMRALGWGCLASRPGELFVGGAVCQPWRPEVVFRAIPPHEFAAFAEPGQVKIAWTIEAHSTGAERTRLVTETRAAATDAPSRERFRRYWRWARFGIVPIRWLLLPAIRREAERRWRARERA